MLSIRLKSVASFVDVNDNVVDVGTDHAYLPIYLMQNNLARKVYACDINVHPLDNAKKNIKSYGLEDKIETILSNGLEKVPVDYNCVLISGMGYDTVISILTVSMDTVKKCNKIVVQVNKNYVELRKWIVKNKFTITDEAVIFEKGKFYQTICFNCTEKNDYQTEEIYLGYYYNQEKGKDWIAYFQFRLSQLKNVIEYSKEANIEYELITAFLNKKDGN